MNSPSIANMSTNILGSLAVDTSTSQTGKTTHFNLVKKRPMA